MACAIHEAHAGDVLTIEKPEGRFLYICLTGGIDVPTVLGSRSTYLPGGFGGLEGRRLRKGDVLRLGPAPPVDEPATPQATALPIPAAPHEDATLALLPGPEVDEIGSDWNTVLDSRFTVSASSDRLGYRLEGPRIDLAGGTIDLWPLYLFLGSGITINTAVNLHATATIETVMESEVRIVSTDQKLSITAADTEVLDPDCELPLLCRLVRYFLPTGTGFQLVTEASAVTLRVDPSA